MKFISQIASGQKVLLKVNELKLAKAPKRIIELNMNRVWPIVYENQRLRKYIPDICYKSKPPRDYFFIVFATVLPDKF